MAKMNANTGALALFCSNALKLELLPTIDGRCTRVLADKMGACTCACGEVNDNAAK
jgi:hypothetical protein